MNALCQRRANTPVSRIFCVFTPECVWFFFLFFFPELSFGQILTSAIFMSAKLRLGLVQSCCGNLAFKPLRRTMVFICWINLWKMCRQCVSMCVCVSTCLCVYLFHLDSSTEFCLYLPRRHSTPETKLHSGKTGKLKAKLVLPVKCYWSPSILPCGVIKVPRWLPAQHFQLYFLSGGLERQCWEYLL